METALIVGIVLAAAVSLFRFFRRSFIAEERTCSCGHGCSCAHTSCSNHDLSGNLDGNHGSSNEPRYSLPSDGKVRQDRA
jgi:hypothetical protein